MLTRVFKLFRKPFVAHNKLFCSTREPGVAGNLKEMFQDLKSIFTDPEDKLFRRACVALVLFITGFTIYEIRFNKHDPSHFTSIQRIRYLTSLVNKNDIEAMAREGLRIRQSFEKSNSLGQLQTSATDYVFRHKIAEGRYVTFIFDLEIKYYTPFDYQCIDKNKWNTPYDIIFDSMYFTSHVNSSRDVFGGIDLATDFIKKNVTDKEKRKELLWRYDVLSSDINIYRRKIPESLKFIKRALKRIPENLPDMKLALECKLALKYAFLVDTENGIDFCIQLLKKFDEKSPKVFVTATAYSLGCLLEVSGKLEEASNFFNLAFDLSKNTNPDIEKAMKINLAAFKKAHKLT